MESTASGGVDRTILRLSFEGHQPDTEAMRRLYDNPESITFGELGTQESTQETQNKGKSTIEKGGDTQESTQENRKNTQEMQLGTQESTQEKILRILRENPSLSTTEVASRLGTTRDGIRKVLDKLRSDGRLAREGSTKAGRWVVKD